VTELPAGDDLCAYRAVKAWMDASGIRDGSLFRTFLISRDATKRILSDNAIDGRDVARAVKRVVTAAGMDAARFAAHSTRRGFVTSADAAGVRRSLIREQGGWKDDRMISTYTRLENVRDNALREMFRRKRQ
jgi:integrase